MPTPSSPPSDLVLVIDPRVVTLLVARDGDTRVLVPIPMSAGTDVVARVLDGHLRAGRHPRVLVSVTHGASHEHVVLRVARVLDVVRAELGFSVIWVPDVRAMAEILARTSSSPDGEDERD